MGSGRWSDSDWKGFTKTRNINQNSKQEEIFQSRRMNSNLNPFNVTRESCDSVDNPNSTPIIIGLDVTGSMGMIATNIAKDGLNRLATEIYNRKPVPDPHILFAGIGDVKWDDAPFQCTQFEADIRIAEQLSKLYIEQGGGGNDQESYTLPWYFASMHTKCDNFIKRGKKGYLFTIGDEPCPQLVLKSEIKKVFGDTLEVDSLSTKELYDMASKQYEIFHIIIEEGSYMKWSDRTREHAIKSWGFLGDRLLLLSDYTKLPELIVSTLQVMNGANSEEVANSWDGSTNLVIKKAIKDLSTNNNSSKGNGLVKF